MKIDIVVPGRFFAFNLALALAARGHDVRVLTNYPKWATAKFGLGPDMTVPYTLHGVLSRLVNRAQSLTRGRVAESFLHRSFARWARRNVRGNADAVLCFSGVAEEVFSAMGDVDGPKKILIRASTHIVEQHRLLREEEARWEEPIDKPSPWMLDREQREYAMADRIALLSSFAYDSCLRQGIDGRKLGKTLLAGEVSRFKPTERAVAERRARILGRQPLRVLMVGSLTPRKGARDFVELAGLCVGRAEFRFVGDIPKSARALVQRMGGHVELVNRVPEHELPSCYRWADMFVFPTIEDGYPVVVAQALTAGLPVICTGNCAGPDVITHGENGWLVPVRSAAAMAEIVNASDQNRPMLAAIADNNARNAYARTWDDVARSYENLLS